MQSAFAEFLHKHPEYGKTGRLDELRRTEYSRLDESGQIYLDYTGGGMYSDRQLIEHMALLHRGVFGNPHSINPSSMASTQVDEQARRYVLEYFNASPQEYEAVFTQNASGALKLLGESYPFGPNSRYLLTFDNHNAVNGIREFARTKGAAITYVPVVAPDLRIDEAALRKQLEAPAPCGPRLFVYPAQSNFSGVQHSLLWIEIAQSFGWEVALDAAAYVPTNRLDLSQVHPDFVPLSFYKMMGYPTGIGCLIARKKALAKLTRPWFSGGTIEMASVQGDRHFLSSGGRAFEDGTIDYLNLPAIELGLKFLRSVDLDVVHARVILLTGWLLQQLSALCHANGKRVVEIYGPQDTHERGGTIALNFLDLEGSVFDFHVIERLSAQRNMSLRTGCFCNPGAGEIAFGLTKRDMVSCFKNEERASFEQCISAVNGKTSGAIRVSLGLVTNFADTYRFLQFARTFLNKQRSQFS